MKFGIILRKIKESVQVYLSRVVVIFSGDGDHLLDSPEVSPGRSEAAEAV